MRPRGDRLLQVAYVCCPEALDAAVDTWLEIGTGPFWMLEARPRRQTHRGAPTDAAVRAAMTFLGDIQVELLAPLDDRPSAWRDGLADAMPAAGLFHHVLLESDDYDATVVRWLAAGAEEGWAAERPRGHARGPPPARTTPPSRATQFCTSPFT